MAVKRTSISVPEMGRWLGLGKTRAYEVIRENKLQTIKVGTGVKKYTRVMLDSFEEWYAGQTHYKKVSENCPIGASFYHPAPNPRPVDEQIQEIFGDRIVYTVDEAKMFLIISRTGMYDLVGLKLFPSVKVNNKYVIPADLFHAWAEEQQFFSLSAEYDLRKDMMARYKGCFFNQQEGNGEPINFSEVEDASIPAATTADDENVIELVMSEDITATAKQQVIDQDAQLLNHLKKNRPVVKPEQKNYYMVHEAAKILNCSLSHVYRLIDTQTIRSKKAGPRVFIFKKEFDEWHRAGGK